MHKPAATRRSLTESTPADPTTADGASAGPTTTDGSWVVLLVAILTSTLTGPGQTIGVSVFIDHFVEDLALTRSQVSAAYLVGTLGGAALLPRVGRFIDRKGVRLAQIIFGFLFALAVANMSMVNGLVWLAIGFLGIRFFGQGSLSLVAGVTVAVRFVRNRGTAIGIFSTASSALMATVPLVLAVVISQVGWRSAWLVAAAFVAVTVLPLAHFGLRSMPTEQPADDPKESAATTGDGRDSPPADRSFTRSEAIRTRAFWMLAAVSGAAGMLGTALNFHQIDLLGAAGLSSAAAAALFIPQVIGSSIAGLTIGYASDRIGTRYLPAIGMALLAATHWMAAVVQPGIIVFAYAVMLGTMGGAVRTTASTLLPHWFGTGHIGAIQGSLTFFNVGASAVGPVLLAVTESGFDSYPPAVILLSAIPAAVMLFSLLPLDLDDDRRAIGQT